MRNASRHSGRCPSTDSCRPTSPRSRRFSRRVLTILSGYSAGAIIVVELARELKRQGKEIGLLVIFDPPSHVPFWLDSFYEVNYRISVATGLIDLVGRLRSSFARRLFHTVLDEGLRTHTSVTREHRVAPYPGRITHFRARLSQSSLVSMKPVGWFWRRTAQEGTEVHWIPGTHYGMLRGSGASVVVDELRDCLAAGNVESPTNRTSATRRNAMKPNADKPRVLILYYSFTNQTQQRCRSDGRGVS